MANKAAREVLARLPGGKYEERVSACFDIIKNRLTVKADEKRRHYEGRTPGAFIPMLLTSGGILDAPMQEAWVTWCKKKGANIAALTERVSLELIRFRSYAYA